MLRSLRFLILFGLMAWWVPGCAGEGDPILPPEVTLDVRGEETYRVGEDIIRIGVTATDPQGLDLEFSVVDPPSRASFQSFANAAVFTWDPITSDVTTDGPRQLVFVVRNSRGVETERSVLLTIQSGNTEPRFLNSNSELYNPASNAPLSFEVRVRDDDSPQVLLAMPGATAPQGASFTQTGDFTGQFEWMPNPTQLQQRTHTVTFLADDDDNSPVEHKVTVVIQQPSVVPGPGTGPNPGAPPEGICNDEVIEHVPLGAQRTTEGFRVEARVNAAGSWDEAAVYWTADDPLSGTAKYRAESLQIVGDQLSGEIPNPLLTGTDSLVISYTICAFSLSDDSIACGPVDHVYRFIAYAPDSTSCQDDGVNYSTQGQAGPIPLDTFTQYRSCQGTPKHHSIDLADGEYLLIDALFSAGTEPDFNLTVNGNPSSLEYYPCLGWAAQILAGPALVQLRVNEDDFVYHLSGYKEGDGPVEPGECVGQEYEPNNTPGQATLVAQDFALFEAAICTEDDRDVYAFELVRGDEYDAFMTFTHADGDLDFTLFAPSQVSDVVPGGFGVAQGWSTTNNESISYVAQESGFHYLSVVTTSTPNTYELIMERSCVVDDSFAGNHSQGTAASLAFDEHAGLKLCANQSDFFTLTHTGSSEGVWIGEVRPTYGSLSALEVTVRNSSGQVVETGTMGTNTVDFQVIPQPGQTYTLEIRSNQPTLYNLTVLDFS